MFVLLVVYVVISGLCCFLYLPVALSLATCMNYSISFLERVYNTLNNLKHFQDFINHYFYKHLYKVFKSNQPGNFLATSVMESDYPRTTQGMHNN